MFWGFRHLWGNSSKRWLFVLWGRSFQTLVAQKSFENCSKQCKGHPCVTHRTTSLCKYHTNMFGLQTLLRHSKAKKVHTWACHSTSKFTAWRGTSTDLPKNHPLPTSKTLCYDGWATFHEFYLILVAFIFKRGNNPILPENATIMAKVHITIILYQQVPVTHTKYKVGQSKLH